MNKSIDRPHVVIVGGGFGGLQTAQCLGNRAADITLLDRNNFHLFQPLLYQVATGGLSPEDIASPLRAILSSYGNIRVLMEEVLEVSPDVNVLLTENRMIDYDYLVLATGSENHYFGNEHWAADAPGLKTVSDALKIRDRVFSSFEEAEHSVDPAYRQACMNFVVVGGGPTGVEMSGALAELAYHTLHEDFRRIDPRESRIYLIEGEERVLPGYPVKLSQKAHSALSKLGVRIVTSTLVKDVGNDQVALQSGDRNERIIPSRNVIWAAGNRSNSLGQSLAKSSSEISLDRSGRVIVNDDLTVGDHSNLFVIGDLAAVRDSNGRYLPSVAPVAIQEGRFVAKSILRSIDGKPPLRFRYRDKGSMAVIGRNAAVADFGRFSLSGFFAWILWAVVHIMNLVEFGNRLVVMTQWAWDYLTRKKGARLIGRSSEIRTARNFGDSNQLKRTA
jgi:NADH dehydrogenase